MPLHTDRERKKLLQAADAQLAGAQAAADKRLADAKVARAGRQALANRPRVVVSPQEAPAHVAADACIVVRNNNT